MKKIDIRIFENSYIFIYFLFYLLVHNYTVYNEE